MRRIGTSGSTARRRKTSRGSVFVEASLVFLAFTVMLIGMFDFGQFLFIHQALVERARFAARWGAIHDPTDSASITNMVLFKQADAPAPGTSSYFHLSASNVSVTSPGAGTDNYYLHVKIAGYSYTVLSPYIAGTYTGPPITVSVPLGLYN